MDTIETDWKSAMPPARSGQIALKEGNAVGDAEQVLLTISTSRVFRFRTRHPWLYGFITFIIGAGVIAVFTMTTYKNWAYEGINLKAALYQIILGGLGGGIASVVLAFAYTASIRQTLPAMKSAAVIKR